MRANTGPSPTQHRIAAGLPFAALFCGVFWLLLSISIFLSYHAHLAMEESYGIWTLQFLAPALGYWWSLRGGSGRLLEIEP